MPWDPGQYLKFGSERLRPAMDLLARVPLESPATIVDHGCGAGNVTRILRERWPGADVLGVDSSAPMLAKAGQGAPKIRWQQADLATWTPPAPVDLLYSNATLHWLDDHRSLFPKLALSVKKGGCLAVQMPGNHAAPSHTALFETAEQGPWRAKLEPLRRRSPVLSLAEYHAVLEPHVEHLDLWETSYLHVLEGEDPVAQWTRGTTLVPLLDALDPADREGFWDDYRGRLRLAYPKQADGRTLFSFRRLFLVAVR